MSTVAAPDQRARIVESALGLMADQGAHATSMRAVAKACDLNVATLYHYFASKNALLAAVIDSRDYRGLLSASPEDLGVERAADPSARMASLVGAIWGAMLGEIDVWRLLLGESLRGEPAALAAAADLSAAFESALADWVRDLYPEIPSPRVTARVLRGVIYGFFIETLPLGDQARRRILTRRAREVGAVVTSTP